MQWTSNKCIKKCDTSTQLLFCSQNHFFYVVVAVVAAVVFKLPNVTISQKGRVKEFFTLLSLTLDFPTDCEPAGITGYKYCRSCFSGRGRGRPILFLYIFQCFREFFSLPQKDSKLKRLLLCFAYPLIHFGTKLWFN